MKTFDEVARERKWLTGESAIRKQIARRTGDLPQADVEIIESWIVADLWAKWPTIKKLKPFIRNAVGSKIVDFRRTRLRENLAKERDEYGHPIGKGRVMLYEPAPGDDDAAFVATLESDTGPEDEVEKDMPEVRAKLADTFSSLPEKQREVAVLILIEELPLTVTAKRLGITATVASSRLYQAKESLRAGALRDVAGDWHLMAAEGDTPLGSDWAGTDCRIGKTAAQYTESQVFSNLLDGVRVQDTRLAIPTPP